MKKFLISISIIGVILFGAVFGLTYMDPEKVEQSAKGWVAQEIERKIKDDFPQLFPSGEKKKGAEVLQRFQGHLGKRIEKYRETLFSDLPDRIAESIARYCTCRMKGKDRDEIQRKYEETKSSIKSYVVNALKSGIKRNRVLIDRVDDLIQGHYLNTIERLMLDLRIFSATNAILFSLILLIMAIKKNQEKSLMIAGGILSTVTLVSTAIYIFGQNWFYTLMF